MAGIMVRANKWLAAVVSLLCGVTMLNGCDPFGANMEKPSDVDLRVFFKQYKDDLKKVVGICEENPSIRWVGKGEGNVDFYEDIASDQHAKESVEAIREALEKLKMHTLACIRLGGIPGDPLADVLFSIYERGIAVSGEGKGIRYRFDWALIKWKVSMDEAIQSGRFKPLNEKGWYIYESQS